MLCEAKSSDLAVLTVDDALFWQDDLRPLEFEDVPDLQVDRIHLQSNSCLLAGGAAMDWRCYLVVPSRPVSMGDNETTLHTLPCKS